MIGDSVENIRPAGYAVSEPLSGSAVRNRNKVNSSELLQRKGGGCGRSSRSD